MSLVQIQTGGSTAGVPSAAMSASWSGSTAASNLLLMAISITGGSGITPSVPAGWTLIERKNETTDVLCSLYEIENASSRSGAETITWTGNQYGNMVLMEYSGEATASALDQHTNSSNTGAITSTTGSITTTSAAELIVAAYGAQGAMPSTGATFSNPTSSFVLQAQRRAGDLINGSDAIAVSDRAVSATGTYSTALDTDITVNYATIIASFINSTGHLRVLAATGISMPNLLGLVTR